MAAVSLVLKGNVPSVNEFFLSMSYEEFDQSKNGWRVLAEKSKFIEAAELIRNYLVGHKGLDLHQMDNLWFHAGQMYAFANDYSEAIACLSHAMQAEQPPHALVQWTPYVRATIAFLRKDSSELRHHRETLAQGSSIDGEIPNLALVDRMIQGLNETYEAIYRPTPR